MKKKLVLRPFVLPVLYLFLLLTLMLFTTKSLYKEKNKEKKEEDKPVIEDIIPVINEVDTYVLNPYIGDMVQEKVGFYDYKGDIKDQENSIIEFDKTYLQNTGITYTSDNDFKVVAIMDGIVTKVYNNELLGNVIEITHDNIVSVYQMVKDIKVSVGDRVTSGFEIATSGTSKVFPTKSNLHFEIIKDGKIENPKSIIGANTKDI